MCLKGGDVGEEADLPGGGDSCMALVPAVPALGSGSG